MTAGGLQTSVPGGQFTSGAGYVGKSAACAGCIRSRAKVALLQAVVGRHLCGIHGRNRHVEEAGAPANHRRMTSPD